MALFYKGQWRGIEAAGPALHSQGPSAQSGSECLIGRVLYRRLVQPSKENAALLSAEAGCVVACAAGTNV